MLGIRISPTMETNIKSFAAFSVLLTMTGFIGKAVAGTYGAYFFLSLAIISPIISFWYCRDIALFSMKAKELKIGQKSHGFDLNQMVDSLRKIKEINLPVKPLVCVIDSDYVNAFATGRSKSHTAIGITTGLLKEAKHYAKGDMKKANRLVEAALVHELGHIMNGDIASKTVAAILKNSLRVLSGALGNQILAGRNELNKNNAKTNKPSLLTRAVVFFAYYLLIPYCGVLVALCLSRTREFAADDFAAKCGRANDMAKSLALLRKNDKIKLAPSVQMEAFADMMCASLNPEADQKRTDRLKDKNIGYFDSFNRVISDLKVTHPPLDARIARMKKAYQAQLRKK